MSKRYDFWAMYDQDIFVDRVMHHPKITIGHVRVLGTFMKEMDREGEVNLRFDRIAELSGVSLSSVIRAVKRFESWNWIVRKGKPHQNAKFMVNPELVWKGKIDERVQLEKDYQTLVQENTLKRKERSHRKNVDSLEKFDIITEETNPGVHQCA